MMIQENKIINIIKASALQNQDTVQFINCIINTIDLIAFELNPHLIIEGCIIHSLQIHSCWFVNGLSLKNNVIKSYTDYQMGGHNTAPIIIEGNVFKDFFNFFDCQFDNIITFNNNILEKGSNLLGNKGEGFENTFCQGYIVENNIGNINLNQ